MFCLHSSTTRERQVQPNRITKSRIVLIKIRVRHSDSNPLIRSLPIPFFWSRRHFNSIFCSWRPSNLSFAVGGILTLLFCSWRSSNPILWQSKAFQSHPFCNQKHYYSIHLQSEAFQSHSFAAGGIPNLFFCSRRSSNLILLESETF